MSRRCFREPIPEIIRAAELLHDACSAHLAGYVRDATQLIRDADLPAIALWTESIWGKRSPGIHSFIAQVQPPPHLWFAARPKPRMPVAAIKQLILDRDGYHCRFCGIPVIPAEVRQHLRHAYPDALRWGPRNVDQHAAFQCMWLQWDHLVPNERGGTSDFDNVVVTCAPCNFGRMQMTLEEADLINPLTLPLLPRPPGFERWDGLTRLLRR
jgi:5-methylcytosine-specific restriction endonuclease McrA